MKESKEQAFKDWWKGNEGDEPITDVPKKRAKEIFFDGYLYGSKKSVFYMTESEYKLFVRMVKDNVAAEEREACARLCENLHRESSDTDAFDCAAAIRGRNA